MYTSTQHHIPDQLEKEDVQEQARELEQAFHAVTVLHADAEAELESSEQQQQQLVHADLPSVFLLQQEKVQEEEKEEEGEA